LKRVFVDTSHHIAILDRRDDSHDAAMREARRLRDEGARFVTSDAVLIEFLTFFSAWGTIVRETTVAYARELRDEPTVDVIPHDRKLFDTAIDFFLARPDKAYSMTDCMSMVICRDTSISDVLTADHDFEQEGFTILL
jgi:hypothetical protein